MAESEEARRRAAGALSESKREQVGGVGSEHREEMPDDVFLEPGSKKYPVKARHNGAWKYDRELLLAAAREARMHHHDELASRADEIRRREFGGAEDFSSAGAAKAAAVLRSRGLDGARDGLVAALKQKFPTPQAAIAALGLDSGALLGHNQEVKTMAHLSRSSARRVAEALRARGYALDADLGQVTDLLEQVEGLEGKDGAGANAGMPVCFAEQEEDADPEFETEEERRDDEAADRRARDMRSRLGREASDEEWTREEEAAEFKPDDDKAEDARRRAEDRRRIRADDARRRLGRDETPEEKTEREREQEAEDRRRARDRAHAARDYRRARDRHRAALDRMSRHAEDWRRAAEDRRSAEDRKKSAMDGKRADDAAREDAAIRDAEDRMRRAEDAGRDCQDRDVRSARDARRQARDRRRAADRRAKDSPPEFSGMPKAGGEMVSKAAMDRAIQEAIRGSDFRHRQIAEALEVVRPKVGKIAMDNAIQGEGDVYSRALDILGVNHAGITELPALKQLFNLASRPAPSSSNPSGFAHDAAPKPGSFDTFRKMFGDQAASIERS